MKESLKWRVSVNTTMERPISKNAGYFLKNRNYKHGFFFPVKVYQWSYENRHFRNALWISEIRRISFLTNLKHGAVTYSSYIELKTRGLTGLQHYIHMKKFQCSSQMCVSEYVYPPHVRCIKFFLMLLSHGGLQNNRVPVSRISCPVCLNCFFFVQVPD